MKKIDIKTSKWGIYCLPENAKAEKLTASNLNIAIKSLMKSNKIKVDRKTWISAVGTSGTS